MAKLDISDYHVRDGVVILDVQAKNTFRFMPTKRVLDWCSEVLGYSPAILHGDFYSLYLDFRCVEDVTLFEIVFPKGQGHDS